LSERQLQSRLICWMASWGSHLGFPLIIILVLVIGDKLLLPKLDSSELDNKERYMTTVIIHFVLFFFKMLLMTVST
jgi:hypothetical protein